MIMRRVSVLLLFACLSVTALAQSNSPEVLYGRAMDAITGIGPSRNDQQGIELFRRSAELGYGPAQIALGYYYDTGTIMAGNQSQALDLYRKAAAQGRSAWGLARGTPLLSRQRRATRSGRRHEVAENVGRPE